MSDLQIFETMHFCCFKPPSLWYFFLWHSSKINTQHDQVGFIYWDARMHKTTNVIHHMNRMKDKNYRLISIDGEKASDKNTTCFHGKTPNKLNTERTHIKAVCDKPPASIILNGESFPCNNRNKKRVSTDATPIQPSSGSPSQSNHVRKRNESKKEKCLCLQIT